MPTLRLWPLGLAALLLASCSSGTDEPPPLPPDSTIAESPRLPPAPEGAPPLSTTDAFKTLWYAGEAELTSYRLEQARYGEIHEGHAVLIFVTEDLSREKQVKLDRPEAAGDDAVKVLKLNATRKFTTGIYPYSTMTSVFSPVDIRLDPHALKVTTSSQEWCGHTFQQLNREGDQYRMELRSYFESEGDREGALPGIWLEDELWTRIRLGPESLPSGPIEIIPGTLYARFRHDDLAPQPATALLQRALDRPGERAYTISYTDIDRVLTIYFEADFPHIITGWTEMEPGGFGPDAPPLTTTAELDRSIMLDYWNRNATGDEILRKDLNLD